MPVHFVTLPTINNVVAGQTATLQVPVKGPTYDRITLELTNVTPAQITNLKVRADGKPFQEFDDGAQVNTLNAYYGRGVQANQIVLYFDRPELDQRVVRGIDGLGVRDWERVFALGTADLQTLDVVFDVDAAAVNPQVTAYATRYPVSVPFGMVTKVKKFYRSAATAGILDIDNIPRSSQIGAIHLINGSVTDIEVAVDSIKILDTTKTAYDKYKQNSGRTLQTGYECVDFLLRSDGSDALVLNNSQDFRVRPTLSAAGSVGVLVEYFDGLAGI